MSFWALSDDNIHERSQEEVSYLFDLLERGIQDIMRQSDAKNIRMYFVGDRRLLPLGCQEAMTLAEEKTQNNTGMRLIFAIGYGGQEEIARAVVSLAKS